MLPKLVCVLLFWAVPVSMAGVLLQPQPAPEWQVSSWLHADPGSLSEHRGRIVLIGFLRTNCPESRAFLLPLLRRWEMQYGERQDVAVRIAQAVETRSTPYLAIVDRQGLLRFAHEGTFDVEPVEAFLERLLEEEAGAESPAFEEASRAGGRRPDPTRELSGTYLFRTDRATGVCGPWVPPMEVSARLRAYRDAIYIEFDRQFLGMDALEVGFDSGTGRVRGEGEPFVSGGGFESRRVFRFEGLLQTRARPPELTFELSRPDGQCTIRGRARGEP